MIPKIPELVAVDYDDKNPVLCQLYEVIEGNCHRVIRVGDRKIFLVDKESFYSVHRKIVPQQRFYDSELFDNHGIFAMRFAPSLEAAAYYFGFRFKRSFAGLFKELAGEGVLERGIPGEC